jgi:hypothetical protein
MSFLRPEITRWFARWAESVGAVILAVAGLWFLWRGFKRFNTVLELIGLVLLVLGAAAFWASFQRTRFARAKQGPGLVEVTERQISYMTPFGGDSIDLDAITRLELRSGVDRERSWVLTQTAGPTLFIPVNAAGADRLFDAFSALPDMDSARLVAAVNATGDQRDVIWRVATQIRALT